MFFRAIQTLCITGCCITLSTYLYTTLGLIIATQAEPFDRQGNKRNILINNKIIMRKNWAISITPYCIWRLQNYYQVMNRVIHRFCGHPFSSPLVNRYRHFLHAARKPVQERHGYAVSSLRPEPFGILPAPGYARSH